MLHSPVTVQAINAITASPTPRTKIVAAIFSLRIRESYPRPQSVARGGPDDDGNHRRSLATASAEGGLPPWLLH